MNICFFNDIQALGGGEIWVLRACRHFASLGHEVSVICTHRSELQFACQRQGVKVFATFEHLRDGLPFYEGLYHFLKENAIEVLYCTVMGNYCEPRVLETLADRVNEACGEPRLSVILKTGLPPLGDISPEYFGAGAGPAVRRLHVVARTVHDSFIDWYPEMGNGFLEILYEGTDLSAGAPDARTRKAAKDRWKVPEDHTVVSCVARLVNGMKGQSVLLRAVPTLLQTHPETVFFIVGDGEDRPLLEELRDDLGLQDTVRFTGHLDDVPALLRATDILCHPSLYDGLPNSVIEAMSISIPVVASRTGGIPEVIEDGVSGRLVRPNDVSSLVEVLGELLGDRPARKKMGRAGRKRLSSDFDLQANLDRLLATLENEVAAFRRAPRSVTAPPRPKTVSPIPVLFLMNVIRTGGEEAELAILGRYHDRKKYRMSVLSCDEVDEPAPALEKLNAWHIPVDTSCHFLPDDSARVSYIVQKIRREQIGIVVACQDTRLAYDVFSRLQPNECRLIEHGGILEDVHSIPKGRTARYVGVSRAITAAAAEVMQDPADAVFIPSMVDMDEYVGPDWEAARELSKAWLHETLLQPNRYPPDTCVVVFVGRLDPKKRVEDLLDAARSLQQECPHTLYLIVGGHDAFQPEYADRLTALATDLVSDNRVAFTGPRSDIPGILCAADILVLPSTGEGMAHVINEAGAAGMAVIATDDGAAREQLDDGECGLIITPGNVAELIAALKDLILDAQQRKTLGARLRSKVLSEYSAEVLVERWHSLFAEVSTQLEIPNRMTHLRNIRSDEMLPFPSEIQIQTNTACNATCIMCPYPQVAQEKEISKGRMDESLYKRILSQCSSEPDIVRIEPFLMNEPFTDRRVVDWIALAKQMVPQASVTVTTNGSLITPKVSDRLVSSGLDAIWFSFNGVTRDTYEKIMGVSYDTVKTNIDYLLDVRPASLQVFVNMIETKPMEPEIARNIREWRERGIEAGTSPLVNRGGNVDNFSELIYMPLSDQPLRVCELPFHKMYILYNGDVVLCCMDWRRKVILGNVHEQSIREIWRSERYRQIRQGLVERKLSHLELCATCSYTHN